MPPADSGRWIRDLVPASTRHDAAQAIAARLGVRALLLFVRDEVLDVMLPAPGMRKTVAGGPRWREFLRRCLQESRLEAAVDLADEGEEIASAVVEAGCALVLVGPQRIEIPAEMVEGMPLLAALLVTQQQVRLREAEAAQARESAARANALAKALDAARASAAQLNQQLREEHQRKDEFLAMLSHELRNPLAPMVSTVQVLRRSQPVAKEMLARMLEVMDRQLQQLTHIVDDLLDVSRVSRGLIELKRVPLRIDDVIGDALEASRPMIEKRGHRVTRSGACNLYVNGDRVRLTQVFSNLLNNAAKYTDPGGELLVSVVQDNARVSVVVKDNGIGIERAMLPRIFEMFAQVPGSLDRSQGGLGIGLTLVRTLVELHGGYVSAHSVGIGHGSTFTVSLPLVAVPSMQGNPLPPPAEASRHALRVMVVDDNRDAAESLAEVLRLMGAEVTVAHDGFQALEAASEAPPELVLLDIGLPGIDGYETARRWRARFGNATRLAALTGYGSEADRRRSDEVGFNLHLVKPVDASTLQKLVSKCPFP